ncbi:MBL fold metallo-hydrolase [Enterococcus faecalis]|uniref:MBL fold metallo-hydrolase n=1 Tax=Enterococcus faecalis TaxID=1351 RepID=UPI002543E72A|nr:MBL fold metallo-hydrolase [Enterococcus faecalis]MDK4411712.1 MBL fold metallo-hydrolase [Enterococcus faecalis]
MIKILQFPARGGDSVLIQVDSMHILVDGGYTSTYKEYIENFLISNHIELDIVICTHYDQDHIEGILPLVESYPHIKDVWYNGFYELFTHCSNDYLTFSEKRKLAADFSYISEDRDNGKEISRRQGESLSTLLKNRCDLIRNSGHDLIVANSEPILTHKEITITIISPELSDLNCLKTKWEKELEFSLKRKTKAVDNEIVEAFENYQLITSSISDSRNGTEQISLSNNTIEDLLSIEPPENDTSVINRAAISFIISSQGFEFLYCSDSDDLTIEKVLKQRKNKKFVGVKVSHHGSIRNNWSWIDHVESNIFFISTDGIKYDNHPSLNVLAKIAKKNPGCAIYFNYFIPKIAEYSDVFREKLGCKLVFPNEVNLKYITIRSSYD